MGAAWERGYGRTAGQCMQMGTLLVTWKPVGVPGSVKNWLPLDVVADVEVGVTVIA